MAILLVHAICIDSARLAGVWARCWLCLAESIKSLGAFIKATMQKISNLSSF